MQRSQEDAEALIRALELVWSEQAGLAKVYKAEATELWRLHAQHERLLAEQRSEIESLRAALAALPETALDAGSVPENATRPPSETRGPIRSGRKWLWSAGER